MKSRGRSGNGGEISNPGSPGGSLMMAVVRTPGAAEEMEYSTWFGSSTDKIDW